MSSEDWMEQTGRTGQIGDLAEQARYCEDTYELRLYVAGNNIKSRLDSGNLKKICDEYLQGKCHVEIIDLAKNPGLAKADQIIAIPTLVRKNYPGMRIIGDLSDIKKVLEFLNLRISNPMHITNKKAQ
jgi:circadian clock protein KaiB